MLMTNDLMLGGVYIVMAIMLVLGSLMARREPAAKMVTMALTWILIFAAGFVLFTFRDDFGWVAERLKAEAVGTPVEQAKETRIPMAIDGHFWVNEKLNSKDVKFIVDISGTMTTMDHDIANSARLDGSPSADEFFRTGNGVIRVRSARADELMIGGITRKGVGMQVADND